MEKVTMYMVTHKDVDFVPDGRTPIFVGAGKSLKEYIRDNTLENISDKNKYFCELTAYYWIWKNDSESDYVSIEHYRRFFMVQSVFPHLITKNLMPVADRGYVFVNQYSLQHRIRYRTAIHSTHQTFSSMCTSC